MIRLADSSYCYALDIDTYQIYHDCGKPYCRVVDDQGKTHFPDHANVSANTWLRLHPDDEYVANLMRMDMDLHIKDLDIIEFSKRPEALTLLITALCEIHANGEMFGGLESTSFKIKWKKLNARGKKIWSL